MMRWPGVVAVATLLLLWPSAAAGHHSGWTASRVAGRLAATR
ncbi:MAG: hypothetical protein ACLF0G_00690 [Candidatus Brocadiia bacterium]